MFTLRRTQEIINQYLSERIEWTVFCKPTELQLPLYGVLLATRPIRACLSGARTHTYTHSPHLACIEMRWDEMFEDGMMDLFPEGYSTGAFSTADSGKLLVLTDLLSAIQHVNRTDRYHMYNCCLASLQTSFHLKGFHIKKWLQLMTNLINKCRRWCTLNIKHWDHISVLVWVILVITRVSPSWGHITNSVLAINWTITAAAKFTFSIEDEKN